MNEVFTTLYPHHRFLFRCGTFFIGSVIAIKWFGTLGLFLRSSRLISASKTQRGEADHKVSRVSLIHPSDVQNGLLGAQDATLVSTTQSGGKGSREHSRRTYKKHLNKTDFHSINHVLCL